MGMPCRITSTSCGGVVVSDDVRSDRVIILISKNVVGQWGACMGRIRESR